MQTYQSAAVLVATVLGVDALLHAYWMTGRTWPAPDTRTLSHAVLGTGAPFTPRVLLPLVLLLSGGATLVLGRADLLGSAGTALPGWVWTAGTLAVAGGTLLRAGAGVYWVLAYRRGTLFHRLNLVAYTPLCALLAAAALTVAVRG